MNILMIYPTFLDSFWSYTHALNIYGRKALLPPLGLLTVAGMLPKDWNKRLVDLNVRDLTDADIQWADYVFISGMAVQRESAHVVTARCKAAGKKIIGGGPLFSGEYALFLDVDTFVLNEAETTLHKLVADITAGTVKRIYRNRDYAVMSTSPVPQWDILDINQYAAMGIQYTRGCPYDCEFCNVTALLGRNPRTKAATQIIAELDALLAAGWRGRVFFVDDNLIGNRPAVKKDLLPALVEWQKRSGPIPFNTQLTINLADDKELTQLMVDAGFDQVFVGIETSDPDALAECSKGQNRNRDLNANVKTLQRAGIEVQSGFIVGFDHDTPKTFQQQVDFIQRSGIVTAMVGQLHAPPGTRLASRMWLEGRLRGHSSGNNTDGSTNIIPKMGLEVLRKGYEEVLEKIFSPKPAYARIKTFLREFKVPKIRRPLTTTDFRAVLRTLWVLGVKGPERLCYWNLLFWTLFTRPKSLPVAIRLAVCVHHYRIMWQVIAGQPIQDALMLTEDVVEKVKTELSPPSEALETAVPRSVSLAQV